MISHDIRKEPAAAEVAVAVVEHMCSLQEHAEALVEGLAYTVAAVRLAYSAVGGKQEHQVLDTLAGQELGRRFDRVQGRDVGAIRGKRRALVEPGGWGIRAEAYRIRAGTSFQVELA